MEIRRKFLSGWRWKRQFLRLEKLKNWMLLGTRSKKKTIGRGWERGSIDFSLPCNNFVSFSHFLHSLGSTLTLEFFSRFDSGVRKARRIQQPGGFWRLLLFHFAPFVPPLALYSCALSSARPPDWFLGLRGFTQGLGLSILLVWGRSVETIEEKELSASSILRRKIKYKKASCSL